MTEIEKTKINNPKLVQMLEDINEYSENIEDLTGNKTAYEVCANMLNFAESKIIGKRYSYQGINEAYTQMNDCEKIYERRAEFEALCGYLYNPNCYRPLHEIYKTTKELLRLQGLIFKYKIMNNNKLLDKTVNDFCKMLKFHRDFVFKFHYVSATFFKVILGEDYQNNTYSSNLKELRNRNIISYEDYNILSFFNKYRNLLAHMVIDQMMINFSEDFYNIVLIGSTYHVDIILANLYFDNTKVFTNYMIKSAIEHDDLIILNK